MDQKLERYRLNEHHFGDVADGVSVLANVRIRQLANLLLANAGCILIRHQRFGLRWFMCDRISSVLSFSSVGSSFTDTR